MQGRLFRLFLFGGLLLAGIFPLVTVGQSTDIKNLLYEELMLSAPTLESAQEHLQFLTTMPRVAGSQFDFQTAQYVRNKFLSWGIPAEMTPIPARLSFSQRREVKIVYPFAWTASLKEAVIPEDPSSNATNIIPSYNAYSPSASVTGGVIYVNYGRLEDYQYLISHNISVEGAIVIARYGVISRNSKVLLAQLQGALGVLLFSDPADSGWVKGPVFPQGPWGPSSRVERGSVLFTPICPGNPSLARLALDGPCLNDNSPTDTTFPSIPSQPLSWEDAYPIISHLRGPIAPINWQGGMNVTYHFGVLNNTDEVQVELTTISNLTSSTIWNVVGTIKGVAEPENMIILGGHRDSWGFGASDPATGTSVLLEVARSFSYLMNTTAWRPRRTIKLCSWDGEEFAFIGSTAYAEDNFDSLYSHAIAYLNVDIGVSGTSLQPAATPSFASFIKNATQRISLPDDGGTLYNNWDLNVRTLGSGSDYVPFLDHVGVASLDITFKSSAYDGVYHSVYDSYYWMEHFGSMPYLKTCAQLFGLLALRLSNDLLLPFNYSDYSARLTTYTRGIEALIKDNDGEEEMTVDILLEAIQEFDETASLLQLERIKLESLIKKANGAIAAPLAQSINHYNQRVAFAERNFTTPGGLENQGRPWYRHLIQAPGIYDGYAPDPFPGLAQAVRDQSWPQAIGEMARIAERIQIASTFLRDAPPVVDEYAGPIMAIRIASIVWGCLCFLVLLGLIAFFTWRYLKNRRLMLLDSGQSSGDQFEYEFLEKEGFVSDRKNKHASMFS